jgi:hypothetical protein
MIKKIKQGIDRAILPKNQIQDSLSALSPLISKYNGEILMKE